MDFPVLLRNFDEFFIKESSVSKENGEEFMGKVTIQSMAKELGLSRNTVAMALKNDPKVAAVTRERVLRIAKKSGYLGETKYEEAIQTRQERHYNILVLRTRDAAVYWDRVVSGISEEASLKNCQTRVAVVTEREEKEGILPLDLDEKIDAIFCIKMLLPEYMQKLANLGYCIFQLDHYCNMEQPPMGDIVRVDGARPVSLLTAHLIEQGMTRIGFLSEHSSTYESMHDRYVGFLTAMKQAGIPLEADLVRPDMESDRFYYPENFDEIVASYDTLPEAIVCGNDMIAKRLTESFRKIGMRVPEDVALTGFDDDEDRMLYPFLSTVHVDTKWLGRRMVHEFLWRKEHPEAAKERILVSGEVVMRRSSCKHS